MPPTDGTGSRKETGASMSDVMTQLDRLEELIRALTAKVGDVDQQQQAMGIALVRLEQGKGDPSSSK
jgi:prefoldin subunit 5